MYYASLFHLVAILFRNTLPCRHEDFMTVYENGIQFGSDLITKKKIVT